MGGALAVHTALLDKINGLVGVVVVDVVEGTALDALSSMQSFLRGRPKNFPSIDNAVEWALRTAQVKNVEAARVSMPGQLINSKTGECASQEVPETEPNVIFFLFLPIFFRENESNISHSVRKFKKVQAKKLVK